MFANLAVNVGINRWNKWFFDALEHKDGSALCHRSSSPSSSWSRSARRSRSPWSGAA